MREDWWVDEKQLDESQKSVILLPPTGNFLLTGPPGSGKSNMLLLRAKYLVKSGNANIAVIVFTRALCDFLKSGANMYEIDTDNIYTYMHWGKSFLRQYYDEAELPEGFRDLRFELLDRITKILQEKKLDILYNTILLDEGQDYMPEEINILKSICTDLFIVADSKQKIYGENDPMPQIMDIVGKNVIELKHHYRNGEEICKAADELGKGLSDYKEMIGSCNYKEKEYESEVSIVSCSDIKNLLEVLVSRINTQLKAYPNSSIGILCPTNKDLKQLLEILEGVEFFDQLVIQGPDDAIDITDDRRIYLSTIHSAKGLEFRAVHLVFAESLKKYPRDTREISYVAVTRAKTSFTAYHINNMPGYLEEALRTRDPVKDAPTIETIIGDIM